MRTEYLEYLLEVARTKSISAAAKKLFIGQTTLSAIINSVENELNVKIFQRTHRGVALTAHGERVIAIAEEMVENNRQLLNLFADTEPTRRNIPLVAYPSACSIPIPPSLVALPPIPTTNLLHPLLTASRITSPTPYVVV